MLGFKDHRQAVALFAGTALVVGFAAAIGSMYGCSSILGDKLNPAYCEAHPTDSDCRKAFPDAGGCTTSAQCSSPMAVCATDKMTCVQCTAAEHDACAGTTPVCGDDDMCRKCSAHTECPSNACLPDGSCGDDTSVAYVDPTGTSTTCTKASPCKKVSDALKTNRPFIKLQGTTNEKVVLNSTNVMFLADPGAKLTDTTNGILLQVEGSSQVAIYDLEIGGASGANTPGVSVQPGSTATLTLTRVKLAGNTGPGISVSSGMVTISQSTISGNTGPGVSTSGGMLIVSRSTVASNSGGGILTSATAFTIRNNFIYRNGNTSTANAGGIGAVGIVDPSVLEFNTIVDNLASGDTLSVGGVLCDHAGFSAPNNLVFRNTGGTSGNVQTLGICSFGNSFISAGTGPVDNTPMFAHPNSTPFDYHLTAASPSTIVEAAGPCTGLDFDGDTRPAGPACDLGADERKP